MKRRSFGRTELQVSEYGLGCARLGGIFQGDTGRHLGLIDAAYDAGITFFDTADMYSQGESERLLGRALHKKRDRVTIASKAGYCLPARRKLIARLKPFLRPVIQRLGLKREKLPQAVRGTVSQDFSPAYLQGAVDASLRRLNTDYLDLFQLHSPPAEVIERGEWEVALESLKRGGKIRYYGISCDTPEAGLAALRFEGVSALQIRLNVLERVAAEPVLVQARSSDVAVIARETLANGVLAKPVGTLDLASYAGSADEQKELETRLRELEREAAEQGRSLAEHALAGASATPGVAVALLGVSRLEQLRELAPFLAR